MILTILACVLVIALTMHQIFTQGFFSSVVMTGLCIVAAVAAFNYYELLSHLIGPFALSGWGGKGMMLIGLFVVILLCLRLITDRLIGGNVNFPVLIDRIGAAAFGLVTALIVTGIVLVGLQNMALPSTLLGFSRVKDLKQPDQVSSLFPPADAFVVGLVNQMSQYGFSGPQAFHQPHPEYLREISLNRLVLTEGSRQESGREALDRTNTFWLIDQPLTDVNSGVAVQPSGGRRFLAVRLELAGGQRGKGTAGVEDGDGATRFTMGQIRLIGYPHDSPRGNGYETFPVGVLLGPRLVDRMNLDQGMKVSGRMPAVDLLFEIPDKLQEQPPRFVEFKRSARVTLPNMERLAEASTSDVDPIGSLKQVSKAQPVLTGEGGDQSIRVENLEVIADSASQPLIQMGLPSNSMLSSSSLSALTSGHSVPGQVYPVQSQSGQEFTPLSVPKGYGLVFLKINSYAGNFGRNYKLPKLMDLKGNLHSVAGYSLEGNTSDGQSIEFAYSPPEDAEAGQRAEATELSEPLLFQDAHDVRNASFFYLIPQKDQPLGIISVIMESRQGSGSLSYRMPQGEALVVPAK